MTYFSKNLDLLAQKFPYIYLLMLVKKEKVNIQGPIKLPIQKDITKYDTLIIYKCLNVDSLEIQNWLKLNKKLIFIEDSISSLYKFFHLKIAYEFLKNKKVSFHFFKNKKQLLKVIEKTKTKDLEVLTFGRQTKKFIALRKDILQGNLYYFYVNLDVVYSHRIFKNFYSNIDKLKKSFLINKFENRFKNVPAVITGAGPSLRYSFDILQRLQNKALIIAGGSSVTCLSQGNILPHLSVMIDPNFEEYKRMLDSLAFEVPLIYSTRVNRGVFEVFNGPLGYLKAGICSFFEIWLENELNISGKYLSDQFKKKAFSVTTISLMLAKLFGCNPIILTGIDLAYSENQRYALNITEDIPANEEKFLTEDKNKNVVYTNLSWETENEWIASFAKRSKKIKFLNIGKTGLKIDHVKDISDEELEKNIKQQLDLKGYIHTLIQQSFLEKAQKSNFLNMKKELRQSFYKCKGYLTDIIKNDPSYRAVLAKEEIKEEIAYKYFLFDMEDTLNKFYQDASKVRLLKKAVQLFLKT